MFNYLLDQQVSIFQKLHMSWMQMMQRPGLPPMPPMGPPGSMPPLGMPQPFPPFPFPSPPGMTPMMTAAAAAAVAPPPPGVPPATATPLPGMPLQPNSNNNNSSSSGGSRAAPVSSSNEPSSSSDLDQQQQDLSSMVQAHPPHLHLHLSTSGCDLLGSISESGLEGGGAHEAAHLLHAGSPEDLIDGLGLGNLHVGGEPDGAGCSELLTQMDVGSGSLLLPSDLPRNYSFLDFGAYDTNSGGALLDQLAQSSGGPYDTLAQNSGGALLDQMAQSSGGGPYDMLVQNSGGALLPPMGDHLLSDPYCGTVPGAADDLYGGAVPGAADDLGGHGFRDLDDLSGMAPALDFEARDFDAGHAVQGLDV